MYQCFLITTVLILIANIEGNSQTGIIRGRILDETTSEPLAFANVTIEDSTKVIIGATTDSTGNYIIKTNCAGIFIIRASYVGYSSQQINGVEIKNGVIAVQDFKLKLSSKQLDEIEITDYKIPLIDKSQRSYNVAVNSSNTSVKSGRASVKNQTNQNQAPITGLNSRK